MACLVCNEPRELGMTSVACAECLAELALTIAITPEQVRISGKQPTAAALVDPWGRMHRLHRRTMVGRELDNDEGLVILDATISRKHAAIEQRGDTWTLRDLGSSNGTYVEDTSFATAMPIRDGERIRFGSLSFIFLDEVGAMPQVDPTAEGFTVRGPMAIKTKELPRISLDEIAVELKEPTGGGGGVALFNGKPVQLTLPQFELVSILYQRGRVPTEHEDVKGFVHPSELMRLLSLDSAVPSEDHVRQLVRRLRRVLFKAGITNVIESRYGVGYRLRLVPV